MEKIYYDEYRMVLGGAIYHVLVPRLPLEEAWAMAARGHYHQADAFVEGDKYFLQGLWEALVTLNVEKDAILYFPLRENPQLLQTKGWNKNCDLVFYNHQIRLPAYRWWILRQMMRFIQPRLRSISYSAQNFLERSGRAWERFRRSSRYSLRRYWPKRRRIGRTLFVTGCMELNCESAAFAYEFLQRDLEADAKNSEECFLYVYILGIDFYYMTKELYESKKELFQSREKAKDQNGTSFACQEEKDGIR